MSFNTNKVVLVGDSGEGKSALAVRFMMDTFSPTGDTTIGAAFFSKTVHVDESKVVLSIWDTAGSERFRSLAPMYIRGSRFIILCVSSDSDIVSKINENVRSYSLYDWAF